MPKVGDKVWVRLGRGDDWIQGELTGIDGNERKARLLETGEKVTVAVNRISRWGNSRIQKKVQLGEEANQQNKKTQCQISFPIPVVPDLVIASDKLRLKDWLKRVAKLGISIPAYRYTNKKQRLLVVSALLPCRAIAGNSAPSWREMAMVGDALWHSYLRIVLIGKGYRNGEVESIVWKNKWETGKKLAIVGHKLELNSLLPILRGKLHEGETAEAFLGWAYTFGGEKSYLHLAQKYLEVLEGEEKKRNDK